MAKETRNIENKEDEIRIGAEMMALKLRGRYRLVGLGKGRDWA